MIHPPSSTVTHSLLAIIVWSTSACFAQNADQLIAKMLEAQQSSPFWLATWIDNAAPANFAFDRSIQFKLRARGRHEVNSSRDPAWYAPDTMQRCFVQPSFDACVDLPPGLRPHSHPATTPSTQFTGWPADWNEFIRSYRFKLASRKMIEGRQTIALEFQKRQPNTAGVRGTLWLEANSGQLVRYTFKLASDIRLADGSIHTYRGTRYEIDFASQPPGLALPVHFRRVYSHSGQTEQLDITYSNYERFEVDSRVNFDK